MHRFFKPSRIVILFVVMGLVLAVYMAALYKLQIFDKDTDEDVMLATNTTTKTVTLTADRGDILDRNGVVLVSTRAAYNVVPSWETLRDRDDFNDIILQLVHDAVDYDVDYTDTFPITSGAPFSYVSDMTSTQEKNLKSYFEYFDELDETISASDLFVWMKDHYGIDYTTSLPDARLIIGVRYELEMRAVSSMNPYIFAEDVGTEFLTLLKIENLSGINIETSAVRVYHTKYAAHLLGYIGLLNPEEYAVFKELGYSYSSTVGKGGVELAFEEYLHGTDGKQVITTSDNGTVIDVTTTDEPSPGENVFLSLDIGLQEVCEDSLAAKINLINADRTEEDRVTGGAAVVLDVNTGEVLACCSYPSYDLSNLSSIFSDLQSNTSNPMFNRATQGEYNPGSTFKMITALAGLRTGTIAADTTYTCNGIYTTYEELGFAPVCWIYSQSGVGHGTENVITALRDSCNVFFYWLGDTLGADALSDMAYDFGFGAKTGIELPESSGEVATPEFKEEVEDEKWYAADTVITAIGQGYSYFTPIQLANYVSTIANGGTRHSLTILSNIRSADFTSVVHQPEVEELGTVPGSEYLSIIQQGMKLVASNGGTASLFADYQVSVAAKTGTVQTSSESEILNNGVFVCYAPADDPEIAISLVVEKGTSGGTIMEIAEEIMDYYFQSKADISVAEDNTIVP